MVTTLRQNSAQDTRSNPVNATGSLITTPARLILDEELPTNSGESTQRSTDDNEPRIDDAVPTVCLRNGVHMPLLGIGTTHSGGYCHDTVVYALKECRYRLIDTAKRYGTERLIAKSIKESGVPREQLFLATKLWPMDFGYEQTIGACHASIERLESNYIDLYMLHFPDVPDVLASTEQHKEQMRRDTWRAMEWLYENGFCRAIGVSNYSIRDLEQLLAHARIYPHTNQIEFHPYYNDAQLKHYCESNGILITGYCPLAKGRILDEPPIKAIANKHNRTPAQICIRYSIDNGVPAIPKSNDRKRMRANSEVFDFHLDEEDLAILNDLHEESRKVIRWDDLQHKFDLPDGYKLQKSLSWVMRPAD